MLTHAMVERDMQFKGYRFVDEIASYNIEDLSIDVQRKILFCHCNKEILI